jgi:multiple sugar transport system permease protein
MVSETGRTANVPLISTVGRKSWRTRFALAMLYVLLCIGGLSMVYPFMLMMATGTKGPTDQNDNRLVPAFWKDDYELFRKYIDDKYSGQLDQAAMFYGTEDAAKLMSTTRGEDEVGVQPLSGEEMRRYEAFLMDLPPDQWEAGFRLGPGRINSRLSGIYQNYVISKYGTIKAVNKTYIEQNLVVQTIQPPAERFAVGRWDPAGDQKWKDWIVFKETLGPEFRVPVSLKGQWIKFLRSKYNNQFDRVPETTKAGAPRFEEVPMNAEESEFSAFLSGALPTRYRSQNPESLWGDELPQKQYDAARMLSEKPELQRSYSLGNFSFILDYILLHGRAVWNTFVFCLLAVLTHLIVNPLAAYALSRYKLPATGKILLFLLATMAFPAEVTMIPGFLLLRDLGLLNTFAALVLPTAASGYSIYLLKGFFDSLPKDLYENAEMEGARETTMMFRITLPLSKPVMAVIALTSFMAAYSAFMFAFLVAQDERMWTMTVWIYQLQARAPKAVMMAALTLAAIPTLLVFLAAQRVILRGIILPGEK